MFLVDPNSEDTEMPRILRARAARLLSSVIEVTLDLHGIDGVQALTDDPARCRTLSALAGGPLDDGPDARARAFVFRALSRGLDAHRLGLTIDDAGLTPVGRAPLRALARVLRVPPVTTTARSAPKNDTARASRANVIALPRAPQVFEPSSVDAHLLGALLATARAPVPASEGPLFERLARDGGTGVRTRFALATLALRVALPHADLPPSLFALALGNVDGAPYGIALRVYDRVIGVLETLLHAKGTAAARPRGAPLLALALHVLERRTQAQPYRVASAIKRERAHARDFAAFTRTGPVVSGTRAPAMPRKRKGFIQREPFTWQPLLANDDAKDGAFGLLREGQVDLFAP